ncbi:hypothetical protein Tco_0785309 [Tanacetum coccineum]
MSGHPSRRDLRTCTWVNSIYPAFGLYCGGGGKEEVVTVHLTRCVLAPSAPRYPAIKKLEPALFSIKLHHARKFKELEKSKYVNGLVAYVDGFDIDKYSVHELNDVMVELGYVNNDDPIYYHYMILGTDLEIGLRALGNDLDVLGLAKVDVHEFDPFEDTINAQPSVNEQERARDDINEPQETLVKGETIAEDKEDSSTKEGDNAKVEWVRHSNSGQEHDHDPISGELDVIDIDNFESGTDSEDDGIVKIRRKKLREIKKANETEVKERVRLYLIKTRRKLFLAKNGKLRIREKCLGRIHMFTLDGEGPSNTKVSREIHACTSKFLSKGIVDQIEKNPNIPLKDLQDELQKKYELGMSRQKVFKAKSAALNQVKGDYRPLKKGFKACGKDLLGLDGAFMKGPYPGQLLIAVGLDGNNGIYPLAYAIVEKETTLIDKSYCYGQCFFCAKHRYCRRHIHENMKKQWNGQAYKELLWICVATTTIPYFDRAMEELKEFNKECFEWLAKIPIHSWSRSHFSGRAKSDILSTPSTAAGTRKRPSDAGTTPSTAPAKKKQATRSSNASTTPLTAPATGSGQNRMTRAGFAAAKKQMKNGKTPI